jgi:photosystem II stability/assembly factor-like uncharacterized protein
MMTAAAMASSQAILALMVSSGGVLFAASGEGLRARRVDENGWNQLLPDPGDAPFPVTALAFTPSNRIVAGIPGGIGYSDDNGESWTFASLPLPAPVITAIAIDPGNERMLFAGTQADGIFRSEDGGDTWTAWNFGLLDVTISAIAITPNDGVLAGTSTGLFQSSNLGRSWTPISGFAEDLEIFAILGLDSQRCIASSGTGLAIKPGHLADPTPFVSRLQGHNVYAIESGPENVIAALVDDAVYVSFDAGVSWEPANADTNEPITAISGFIETESGHGLFTGSADGSVRFVTISQIASDRA